MISIRHSGGSFRRCDCSIRHFDDSFRRLDSSFRRFNFYPSLWRLFPSL
ncbi:hypothetical protein [Lysinibacillus sp. G4S2]|nr:hypothetical protein [Lysinibacillus sp. G4S2]MDM5250152.1 hypothetical protein [Lysinibacillus sp. G4S2]